MSRTACPIVSSEASSLTAVPMALPKRRQSRARTAKRRSHDALTMPNIPGMSGKVAEPSKRSTRFYCPGCKQPKEPHCICGNCGYYNGRQAVAVKRA